MLLLLENSHLLDIIGLDLLKVVFFIMFQFVYGVNSSPLGLYMCQSERFFGWIKPYGALRFGCRIFTLVAF